MKPSDFLALLREYGSHEALLGEVVLSSVPRVGEELTYSAVAYEGHLYKVMRVVYHIFEPDDPERHAVVLYLERTR